MIARGVIEEFRHSVCPPGVGEHVMVASTASFERLVVAPTNEDVVAVPGFDGDARPIAQLDLLLAGLGMDLQDRGLVETLQRADASDERCRSRLTQVDDLS